MLGRFSIFFLLLFAILQTNLYARQCYTRTNTWIDFNGPIYPVVKCETAQNECGSQIQVSAVCTGSCVNRGYGHPECQGNVVCCDDNCSADSARCINNGDGFDSRTCTCIPDTTFHCTSISSENNVIRSQIDYIIYGDSVVKQNYVLGSCISNNFCEGGGEREFDPVDNPTYAYDSCSYDSVSLQRCKFVGQNGSSCRYVCPDGRNWNCRMGWAAGGVDLPQCPSKPWKDCADEYIPVHISTPANPMSDSAIMENVISAWPPPDFSDPDLPEQLSRALDTIVEALKENEHNNKLRQYADTKLFDVVAGYGDWDGDGLWQNTKRVVLGISDLNADVSETNSRLESVVINQETIIKKAEFDTFKVAVQNDSTTPVWVLPNWEPLVFAVDTTAEKIKGSLDDIKNGLDTLVNDTPQVKPILRIIVDKFEDVKKGLDSLVKNSPNPLDYAQRYAKDVADSIEVKIKPIVDALDADSSSVDSLVVRYAVFSPDTLIPVWPSDSLPNDSLPPVDSATFVGPFDDVYNYLDSLKREQEKQDTTKDTLPLDQMSGDSVMIRNKLTDVFLTDVVLNSCFEFHMHPVVNFTIFKKNYSYDLSIVIDFADMFGWDLCELIRKIVEILTFIAIVFTTIKGYMRAFGGTNIGG